VGENRGLQKSIHLCKKLAKRERKKTVTTISLNFSQNLFLFRNFLQDFTVKNEDFANIRNRKLYMFLYSICETCLVKDHWSGKVDPPSLHWIQWFQAEATDMPAMLLIILQKSKLPKKKLTQKMQKCPK
jgi:hypothetical protein